MRMVYACLLVFLAACGGVDVPPLTESADVYFRGTWELRAITDGIDSETTRPPTETEARTWHVFTSEDWAQDTVRLPVTVTWGTRSGVGYWYFSQSGTIRIEIDLQADGTSEHYVMLLDAVTGSGEDGRSLGLSAWPYAESYRWVGPP
jgi:hypothetical protein